MAFIKASKKQSKLRLDLEGPAGSGKTFSALAIATGLGKRIAVIDTERGSASLYSDKFEFDVAELETFAPHLFTEKIREAERAGYDVIIIDSLSHAWTGKGGALEMKDNAARKNNGNTWTAWRDVTPEHNDMVDAILQCKAHVIVTMRTRMEHVQEKDEKGKTIVRKVGMKPIQRDGMEYEFTIVGDMSDGVMTISKTRFDKLSGACIAKPGRELGEQLRAWLESGEKVPEKEAMAPAASSSVPPPTAGSMPSGATVTTVTVDDPAKMKRRVVAAQQAMDKAAKEKDRETLAKTAARAILDGFDGDVKAREEAASHYLGLATMAMAEAAVAGDETVLAFFGVKNATLLAAFPDILDSARKVYDECTKKLGGKAVPATEAA